MSRGPWEFKPNAVARALSAAKKAGFDVASYRVTKDGAIEVQIGKPPEEPPSGVAPSPDIIL